MPSANQTLVRRFFNETCNQGKLEVADEIFSPDHRYHDPSNPFIVPGPEGVKQLISTYQRAFTGAHWEIEEMIEAGDRVVTRWTGWLFSGKWTDFTYKISPTVISIFDTGLGSRPVSDDIEAVLRKIEYWHQGSIATFRIMARDDKGFSSRVRWDGKTASLFPLEETDEREADKKLFERNWITARYLQLQVEYRARKSGLIILENSM
jgi:hypothetical protein